MIHLKNLNKDMNSQNRGLASLGRHVMSYMNDPTGTVLHELPDWSWSVWMTILELEWLNDYTGDGLAG